MTKFEYYVKAGFILVKAGFCGLLGIASTSVGTVFEVVAKGCRMGLDRCETQVDELNREFAEKNKDKC